MIESDVAEDRGSELWRGEGSIVYTRNGHRLIDLACGFGSVFLGHAHAEIVDQVQRQLGRIWSGGSFPIAIQEEARQRIAEVLPLGFRPCGLYSTGMESVEFAMRIAACHTGRNNFVGFARSMHGKSALTAGLCWDNASIGTDRAHTLAFIDVMAEAEILERLEKLLARAAIAAVLVEPMQGSNGCLQGTPDFYQRVIDLCRRHGTLSVFDEILTGLYRTGPRFCADLLPVAPDVLVFAKSIGNGFPASSVAVHEHIAVGPPSLPGSTFAGNPLAAAAVAATLRVMQELPVAAMIATIESVLQEELQPCRLAGIGVRGRGALWALELGPHVKVESLRQALRDCGVLVTCQRNFIRLLPAATIEVELLREACKHIARACIQAQLGED